MNELNSPVIWLQPHETPKVHHSTNTFLEHARVELVSRVTQQGEFNFLLLLDDISKHISAPVYDAAPSHMSTGGHTSGKQFRNEHMHYRAFCPSVRSHKFAADAGGSIESI